ncbi:MAG: hypothetical protein ACFCVC_18590 [Acidimicrobiia bacterium]
MANLTLTIDGCSCAPTTGAAAVAGGCTQLLTEDMNSGQIIRGVELVNPFELA